MGQIENFKNRVRNLPEFSDRNYNIVGYIFAALITIAGGLLIYNIISTDGLTFKANWNMFSSPLGNLCFGIGLICAIIFWGKFGHWSRTPYLITKDEYGNIKKVERHYDIIETLFWTILFPFIGHFVIEPIIYGALIYYPIQCIVAVVGAIFPYILSVLIIGIIVVSWKFTSWFHFKYHSALLVFAGLFFTCAFSWAAYYINITEDITNITIIQDDSPFKPRQDSGSDDDGKDRGKDDSNDNSDDDGKNKGNGDEDKNGKEDGNGDGDGDGNGNGDGNGGGDRNDGGFEEPNEDNQGDTIYNQKIIYVQKPCDGLYKKLPEGVSEYEGDISGNPILFTITKHRTGELKGSFKDTTSETKLGLRGESLPDCNIKFHGKVNDEEWIFYLSGTPDDIFGSVQINNSKKRGLTLYKKGLFDDDFE